MNISHFYYLYSKTFETFKNNLTALIGDSCDTKQSIAKKLKMPLLRCARHQGQVPVGESIVEEADVVQRVCNVMVKVWTTLLRPNFCEDIQCCAKLCNKTPWISAYSKLQRHEVLREFLSRLNHIDLSHMLLLAAYRRKGGCARQKSY